MFFKQITNILQIARQKAKKGELYGNEQRNNDQKGDRAFTDSTYDTVDSSFYDTKGGGGVYIVYESKLFAGGFKMGQSYI